MTALIAASLQVAWAFSIYLEAVAIIPQLIVLHAEKVVENVTSHYVATLGLYRACYIINWIYKYSLYGTTHWIVWTAGVVQTAFYCDFFYYYFRRCVAAADGRVVAGVTQRSSSHCLFGHYARWMGFARARLHDMLATAVVR